MQTQWSMMRENSERIVRTSWPRSGTSTPSIFSTVRTKPTPLIIAEHVVEPVRVRDDLVPVVRLGHLLEAAVEIADFVSARMICLAVEPRDEVDDPVRRRVRRPDRDRLRLEVAGRSSVCVAHSGAIAGPLRRRTSAARGRSPCAARGRRTRRGRGSGAGSGCPGNSKPKRSKASRSNQFAAGQIVADASGAPASPRPAAGPCTRTCSLRGSEWRWTTASNRVVGPGRRRLSTPQRSRKRS